MALRGLCVRKAGSRVRLGGGRKPKGLCRPSMSLKTSGHMAVSSCRHLGPWAPCHRVKPRRDCCVLHYACEGATRNPLACNLLKQLCWLVDFEHSEGKKHKTTFKRAFIFRTPLTSWILLGFSSLQGLNRRAAGIKVVTIADCLHSREPETQHEVGSVSYF